MEQETATRSKLTNAKQTFTKSAPPPLAVDHPSPTRTLPQVELRVNS